MISRPNKTKGYILNFAYLNNLSKFCSVFSVSIQLSIQSPHRDKAAIFIKSVVTVYTQTKAFWKMLGLNIPSYHQEGLGTSQKRFKGGVCKNFKIDMTLDH